MLYDIANHADQINTVYINRDSCKRQRSFCQ